MNIDEYIEKRNELAKETSILEEKIYRILNLTLKSDSRCSLISPGIDDLSYDMQKIDDLIFISVDYSYSDGEIITESFGFPVVFLDDNYPEERIREWYKDFLVKEQAKRENEKIARMEREEKQNKLRQQKELSILANKCINDKAIVKKIEDYFKMKGDD